MTETRMTRAEMKKALQGLASTAAQMAADLAATLPPAHDSRREVLWKEYKTARALATSLLDALEEFQ